MFIFEFYFTGQPTEQDSNECSNIVCSTEFNPQCGKDGLTYGNPCLLEVGQCRHPELTLAYHGMCKFYIFLYTLVIRL